MWNVHISKGFKQLLNQLIPAPIKTYIHRGNQFLCPFCNFQSNSLALIGRDIPVLREKEIIGSGLRNGGCFKCGSTDRERLIYIYLLYILEIFNSTKTKSILHIAPEKNLSNKIKKHGFDNYVCGDLFANSYRYPKHVQKINVLDIPFKEESFDLVICNHVLEHISDDKTALKEINRVLKKGGLALLQVPISRNSTKTLEGSTDLSPKEREKQFGQFDHVRIYGQDYIDRLESNGFIVEKINISSNFSYYGLNKDEDIFLAKKSSQK